ncbi:MAG TPA: glycosyltransferase, partial [Gemmataceae bacterium]|nr:glycosyltransferase [Gemmataceae bacterium]
LLARSLAEAGHTVEVWAPPAPGPEPSDPGVRIHRLPDHFGAGSLRALDRAFRRLEPDRRLLVQYVPHAFGWKAMNLPFCLWLHGQRLRERIWVMFHEVAFPISLRQSLRHNLLGCVTRLMAALVTRGAERCFVSTLSWSPLVRQHYRRPIEWLPIPSNLPTEVPSTAVAAARARYGANAGRVLIGHFGTFGDLITPLVDEVLPCVVAASGERVGLLIGRGSEKRLPRILESRPDLAGRLFATGPLPAADLAAHLAACDLLVQPFRDGATTRRTSLMAGLALGVPVVTTSGTLTEPLWSQEELVALAPAESPVALAELAQQLLANTRARQALGRRGQQGYRRLFSIERTVQAYRQMSGGR